MKPEEKLLCNYMADFFEEKFDKINDEFDWEDSGMPTDKKEFIKEISSDAEVAIWSLTELACWGMDKDHFNEMRVFKDDNNDFWVIKIDDKYIKIHINKFWNYQLKFVEPKTKTVTYFE